MALIIRNIASLLCKKTVVSQSVRQNYVRLCAPIRLSSNLCHIDKSILSEETLVQKASEDVKITSLVISKVNEQIEAKSHGRLFAIIQVCGKQYKVTTEDLIVVEGYWAPVIGDQLNLKKILLVGGSDFTLIGRPILPHGLVSIQATVIEKSMSHTKTSFRKRRRKQYMRINFFKAEYTVLRINTIEILENVNVKKEVEGLEGRIF